MNENIVNYLDQYITKNDIHFATLLKGKWGTGKTFFINNYIKEVEGRDNNFKVKFIYVSLFGLKNLESVNEVIFQQFHPILGSKTAKIATNVLKGALRIGINLDLNKDGKNETLNADFSKTDFLSYFEGDKRKQAVFIFDDLERTQIPIGEILGFINGFVEHSGAKVIIICNEEEISEIEVYERFKEKVINRSFSVQADMESFWANYVHRFEIISNDIEEIKKIFEKYGEGNLRVLSHVTENYLDFLSSMKERFKENQEFMVALTEKYFVKALYKKLNKDEVKKEHDTDFDRAIRNLPFYSLFSAKDWDKIIDGDFDKDLINANIEKLVFFQDKKEEKSWVTLWHYLQKNEIELNDSLFKTQQLFEKLEYSNPAELIHVFSLLIYFKKNGIGHLTLDSIANTVDKYINKYVHSEEWGKVSMYSDFNGTGLGFFEQNDSDIKVLVKKVQDGIDKAKDNLKNQEIQNDLNSLQTYFQNAEASSLGDVLAKYEHEPILHKLDGKQVFDKLIKNEVKSVHAVIQLISYRYRENLTINSKKLTYYLKEELPFLETLLNEVQNYIDSIETDNFDKVKMITIQKYLLQIIDRFQKEVP